MSDESRVYQLTLYGPAGEQTTTYEAANAPIAAVRKAWPFARLHTVDNNKGVTVWSTPDGLVRCETAKLPEG